MIPEIGGEGPILAEHKDIADIGQTVNVSAPAADLVKTGESIAKVAIFGTVMLVGTGVAWATSKFRKVA